ncbi:MAG: hypothetical protein HKN24_02835 [Acidimicrobiales bacterium]|nr:hypothetical protein [Acidimicrobiales bacterium]
MSGPVIFRPAQPSDVDSIWPLVRDGAHEIVGMTSLPSTRPATVALLDHSAQTLTRLATGEFELARGGQANLLMVAVQPHSGEVVGTSGMTFKKKVPNLAVQVTTSLDGLGLTMRSSSDPWSRTELNSIYVGSAGRGQRLGTLLSRGRFMFLHLVRSQTPTTIAAHIRGLFDDDGVAPFWQSFGAQFVSWGNSIEAEQVLAVGPERLDELADRVLPLTPTDLRSLGVVNAASMAAFRMLIREGLRSNGMYDPIDGGPTVAAELANTTSGRQRVHGPVVVAEAGTVDALVAVPSVARFAAVRTEVSIAAEGDVRLTADVAASLGVTGGDLITVLPLDRPESRQP